MAKFNIQYVKQHPVMFGAIVIVFGLLFWMLINRGGSGGSSITVANGGPSDAQVAAGVQLQMAQLQANTQAQMGQLSLAAKAMEIEGATGLATLESAYRMAELEASHDLGTKQIEASMGALLAQLETQSSMAANNNAFMLDYAVAAHDAANTQIAINAALQRDLGQQQLEGFKFSGMMQAIGSLKKKDRDDTLERIYGNPEVMQYSNPSLSGGGGGGFLSGVAKIVAPIPSAIL